MKKKWLISGIILAAIMAVAISFARENAKPLPRPEDKRGGASSPFMPPNPDKETIEAFLRLTGPTPDLLVEEEASQVPDADAQLKFTGPSVDLTSEQKVPQAPDGQLKLTGPSVDLTSEQKASQVSDDHLKLSGPSADLPAK